MAFSFPSSNYSMDYSWYNFQEIFMSLKLIAILTSPYFAIQWFISLLCSFLYYLKILKVFNNSLDISMESQKLILSSASQQYLICSLPLFTNFHITKYCHFLYYHVAQIFFFFNCIIAFTFLCFIFSSLPIILSTNPKKLDYSILLWCKMESATPFSFIIPHSNW